MLAFDEEMTREQLIDQLSAMRWKEARRFAKGPQDSPGEYDEDARVDDCISRLGKAFGPTIGKYATVGLMVKALHRLNPSAFMGALEGLEIELGVEMDEEEKADGGTVTPAGTNKATRMKAVESIGIRWKALLETNL